MDTLKSIFDATFVHMTVGFLGMLVAAFVVAGAAGFSGQRQQAQESAHAHSAAYQ